MANPSPIAEAQKTIIDQLRKDGLLPDRYRSNDWELDEKGKILMDNGKPVRRLTSGDYHFSVESAPRDESPCAQINVYAKNHDGKVLARQTVSLIAGDNLVNPGDLFPDSFFQKTDAI